MGYKISTSDRTHARNKADTLNTEKESHTGRKKDASNARQDTTHTHTTDRPSVTG